MTPPQKFFLALSLIRFSQSWKSQNALNSNGIQFWVHQGGKIRFSVAGRLEALWTFGPFVLSAARHIALQRKLLDLMNLTQRR